MDNAAKMTTCEGGGGGANVVPSGANTGATTGDEAQPQLFCLRWNNYQTNLTCSFDQLLQSELLVDVTLACADGQFMKAHRMVLSACSPYFQTLFSDNPCKHPIVILKDIGWSELKAVVEFMYKGEINVCQEQIEPLLKVAESLKIRGLADVSSGQDFARAAAASTERSPDAAPVRASPSRGAAGAPARKRRRTSVDRVNGAEDGAYGVALNSPSRALELISSPMAATQSAPSQSGQHHRPPSQASAAPQSPPMPLPIPPPPHSANPNAMAGGSSVDDMEIKPGIAEMIREEERAKMFESSQAWLNASTSSLAYAHPTDNSSSILRGDGASSSSSSAAQPGAGSTGATAGELALADLGGAAAARASATKCRTAAPARPKVAPAPAEPPKLKTPSWTKAQLKQAIKAVITQQLRFTEASSAYNIPKGTLYDNILGKTKRMRGLDVAALSDEEEAAVLEFCCNVSASTYNRRTPRALREVLEFVEALVRRRNADFRFDEMSGFRWWWAFCKKHSVLVLNYTSLSGETFVAAGCDRVRGAAARAKAVKRYLRQAKATQLRLDAHVTTEPFDFSRRNSTAQVGATAQVAAAQVAPAAPGDAWSAQQFLSTLDPLAVNLFADAQTPAADILNSLLEGASVN